MEILVGRVGGRRNPLRAYVSQVAKGVSSLLSYGIDRTADFRRAATYVGRILKGEKPTELPVRAPIEFELVVNLKTAKAMGLDVPLHLQQRANEIIE